MDGLGETCSPGLHGLGVSGKFDIEAPGRVRHGAVRRVRGFDLAQLLAAKF
jgi:hypothetical protein